MKGDTQIICRLKTIKSKIDEVQKLIPHETDIVIAANALEKLLKKRIELTEKTINNQTES